MSFGQPSFIATHLVGDGARAVTNVRAQIQHYSTTSGPWNGIGGAAISTFTITELRRGNIVAYYADERFIGWANIDSRAYRAYPRIDVSLDGLHTDPATCPVPELVQTRS